MAKLCLILIYEEKRIDKNEAAASKKNPTD